MRELNRYGGAFAAEWRRPEASPRIIPGHSPGTWGSTRPEKEPRRSGSRGFAGRSLPCKPEN